MSKSSENSTHRKKPWVKFELDSFESPSLLGHGQGTGFVPAQADHGEGGDFIPLKETTDYHKKRRQADDILKDAREKADRMEREAYEKGFAQGEKDGVELGQRKAVKVIENIERLLVEISTVKEEILRQYEREILEIVFAIAQKVIHRQIQSDDKVIEGSVLEVMKLAVEKSRITLRVNPEDLEYIEELRPKLFSTFKELKALTVTGDDSITRGGCFLETPYGDVDARVETQLERIHQCIEGAFAER